MTTTTKTYSFKKGEKFSLDDIYEIQGLGGGDWWERTGEDVPSHKKGSYFDESLSEALICVRTIKITIIVETK